MKKIFFSFVVIAGLFFGCTKNATTNSGNLNSSESISNSVDESFPQNEIIENGSVRTLGRIYNADSIAKTKYVDLASIQSYLNSIGRRPNFKQVTGSSVTGFIFCLLNSPHVEDQGSYGDCVSFAIGYCQKTSLDLTWHDVAHDPGNRSPFFIYNAIHFNKDDCKDDGLNDVTACRYCKNYGVASKQVDDVYETCDSLPAAYWQSAATDKIKNFAKVSSSADARTLISLGLPVSLGFNWFHDFTHAWNTNGVWSTCNKPGNGGHQVCLIGYDDSKQAFLLQNSWGINGGTKEYPGCMWVTYALVDQMLATNDFDLLVAWQ
jgi:hypothetical protein